MNLHDWVDSDCAHWSPLELKFEKKDYPDPNADYDWSPLEIEIENRYNAELSQMVIMLEFIGVGEWKQRQCRADLGGTQPYLSQLKW